MGDAHRWLGFRLRVDRIHVEPEKLEMLPCLGGLLNVLLGVIFASRHLTLHLDQALIHSR